VKKLFMIFLVFTFCAVSSMAQVQEKPSQQQLNTEREPIEQTSLAREVWVWCRGLMQELERITVDCPGNKLRYGLGADYISKPDGYGRYVLVLYSVYVDSAAARAGIKPGDRLVTINGFTIESYQDGSENYRRSLLVELVPVVDKAPQSFPIVVERKGETLVLTAIKKEFNREVDDFVAANRERWGVVFAGCRTELKNLEPAISGLRGDESDIVVAKKLWPVLLSAMGPALELDEFKTRFWLGSSADPWLAALNERLKDPPKN